jgi:hypothetical protein
MKRSVSSRLVGNFKFDHLMDDQKQHNHIVHKACVEITYIYIMGHESLASSRNLSTYLFKFFLISMLIWLNQTCYAVFNEG